MCIPPGGPSQHVFLLPLMAHTRKPFPAPPVGFRPDGGQTGTYARFTVRLWLNAAHLARSRRLPKFPNNRTGGPRTPRVSVPLRMTSCASSWTYAAVAGFCRIRYLSVFACVPRSEQCAEMVCLKPVTVAAHKKGVFAHCSGCETLEGERRLPTRDNHFVLVVCHTKQVFRRAAKQAG